MGLDAFLGFGFPTIALVHAGLVFFQCGSKVRQLSQYDDLRQIGLPCPPSWSNEIELEKLIEHRCRDHWPSVGELAVNAVFWSSRLRRIGLVPLPAYLLGFGLLMAEPIFRSEVDVSGVGYVILGLGLIAHLSYLVIKYRAGIAPTLCACMDKYGDEIKVLLDVPAGEGEG